MQTILPLINIVVPFINIVGVLLIIVAALGARASVCSQIYSRWQSLLFKTSDIKDAYNTLATTAYEEGKRSEAHYIAVGHLNLFEEAYLYRKSRFLIFGRLLPNRFWISIQISMKKHFKDWKYLRTFWQIERSSYSEDFNKFIEQEIIS